MKAKDEMIRPNTQPSPQAFPCSDRAGCQTIRNVHEWPGMQKYIAEKGERIRFDHDRIGILLSHFDPGWDTKSFRPWMMESLRKLGKMNAQKLLQSKFKGHLSVRYTDLIVYGIQVL